MMKVLSFIKWYKLYNNLFLNVGGNISKVHKINGLIVKEEKLYIAK